MNALVLRNRGFSCSVIRDRRPCAGRALRGDSCSTKPAQAGRAHLHVSDPSGDPENSGQNKGPGRISTACHDLASRLCALIERFGTVGDFLRPNTLSSDKDGTTHRALP